MDINQNYREAVKTIKEAILRSQYRAAFKSGTWEAAALETMCYLFLQTA